MPATSVSYAIKPKPTYFNLTYSHISQKVKVIEVKC